MPVARGRRRPSRAAPLTALAILLVGVALAGYFLSRPKLIFTNTLVAPIWLTVGQARPRPASQYTAATIVWMMAINQTDPPIGLWMLVIASTFPERK